MGSLIAYCFNGLALYIVGVIEVELIVRLTIHIIHVFTK